MKSLRILPVLALTGLLVTHCRGQRPLNDDSNASRLSTFKIGELTLSPNASGSNWTSLKLQLDRLRPNSESIKKSYDRKANLEFEDSSATVPYGFYQIVLSYVDAKGQALYESCADEKTKEHNINQPTYLVEIGICSVATGAPAGKTKVEEAQGSTKGEEAQVSIKPVVVTDGTKPTPSTGSFVEQHGSLIAKNGKLLDKNQQPIQLKGMSLFWSQWSGTFWNADVVKTLKNDWKSTVVRAAMGVEEGGYLSNPAAEKARVKTIVDAAVAQGIYVIIDWHDHNALAHTAEAVAFFSEMAGLYANTPNVIFEVYNEPINVSWEEVKAYAETVIKAIRAKNAKNLVIVGSPTWSQRVDLAADKPIAAENVAYTLHFYAGTHRQELRDKASYAISKGLTLFVTEFGVCDASGNGNIDLKETDLWMEFLNKHKISWANWSLFDKDESASALKPGASAQGQWTDQDLTISGAYIKKRLLQ